MPTGSDISDFIHNLETQDIKVEMMRQGDYMAAAPHSAAINVTGSSKVKVTLMLARTNLPFDTMCLIKWPRMWAQLRPRLMRWLCSNVKGPLLEGRRVLQAESLLFK